MDAPLIVSILLALCVGTVAAVAVILSLSIRRLVNIVVTDKEDQLARQKIEAESELGREWVSAQERMGRRAPINAPVASAPDIHVEE